MASRSGFACPDFHIPFAEEDEVNELMVMAGLRPPYTRYETDALAKQLTLATHMFPSSDADADSARLESGVVQ